MNVEITGTHLNGYFNPDRKNKTTGEVVQGDFIVQMEQKKLLEDGSVQLDHFDIPVDRAMAKSYQDKKPGDLVKVPCNVYGENFAELKFSKAKK